MRTILVSAYGCEPGLGSEQGVGWNWVLQMAKSNKVVVITRANNRKKIEGNIPDEVMENIVFCYYDTHPIIRKLKKRAKGLYPYYFFWQFGIISLIRKLVRQNQFDFSIHLTFGSIWMPTFLPLFNIPFIWGPIGGGECIPKSFLKDLPIKDSLIQRFRYFLNYATILNPFVCFSSYKAIAIITRTKLTANAIPKLFRTKTKIFLETAIEYDIPIIPETKYKDKQTIKLITSGRLVPFKNTISLIRALSHIPDANIILTIIGSGSEEDRITQEIIKFNLTDKVIIIPTLSRNDAVREVGYADIFIFPSLREGGSWALMEAMALGLPVVCLKWSGMEVITDDSCAIRLPVTNPEQMPKDMANAIIQLIENPELRRQMGEAGRERIRTYFNWEDKGRFMEYLFNELEQGK